MRLNHPNIIATYAIMGDKKNVYFLMEYMDSKTLANYL